MRAHVRISVTDMAGYGPGMTGYEDTICVRECPGTHNAFLLVCPHDVVGASVTPTRGRARAFSTSRILKVQRVVLRKSSRGMTLCAGLLTEITLDRTRVHYPAALPVPAASFSRFCVLGVVIKQRKSVWATFRPSLQRKNIIIL